MNKRASHTSPGFTIVELLIVIVVIAILAAITIVAYNGIQQRARDSQRQNDIKTIAKALEMYYLDNGQYPHANGSTTITTNWSTTADSSWQSLASYLVPKYISSMPSDPTSTSGANVTSSTSSGYDYAYYSPTASTYCGVQPYQFYILVYRVESGGQQNTLSGDCTGTAFGPYTGASNYRIVKN